MEYSIGNPEDLRIRLVEYDESIDESAGYCPFKHCVSDLRHGVGVQQRVIEIRVSPVPD